MRYSRYYKSVSFAVDSGSATNNIRVRGADFDTCCKNANEITESNADNCCRVCGESGVKDLTHITHGGGKCSCYSIPTGFNQQLEVPFLLVCLYNA